MSNMNPDLNSRASAKRLLTYAALVAIIGSVGYYLFYTVTDLLLPAQVSGPVDPLDDSGKIIGTQAEEESVSAPSFLRAQEEIQAKVSDGQKAKTLGAIRANPSISEARKKQIMDELSRRR